MAKWLADHKSISIGGGITMLTALGQIFSDKVKLHPHFAAALFLVGVLMVIVPLIAPFFSRKESPLAAANSNSAGRDNFGHLIHAPGGTVIIGDNNTTNSKVSDAARPASLKDTRTIARLGARLELTRICYDVGTSAWQKTTSYDHLYSHIAAVVWFSNPLAPKGKQGVSVQEIAAHLSFTLLDIPATQIETAHWLGKSENRISIASGGQAGVIVAMEKWGRWVTYSNPYDRPAHEEFLQPALRSPGTNESLLNGQNLQMHVQISLIASDSTVVETIGMNLGFKNGNPYGILNT